MARDDNDTLRSQLLVGVVLFLIGFAMVTFAWPRTSLVTDSFGDTVEHHGSRPVVMIGLFIAVVAQGLLWTALTGFGVKYGVLAARQTEQKEAEKAAAKVAESD